MITLVTGENEYAIKEHADRLAAEFEEKNGEEGVKRRRGEDLERKDIPDLFGGTSLFSAQQLVIIDEPGANQELADYLASQTASLPADIDLVLLEPKPDKRTKWYKALRENGRIVEKPRLNEGAASSWVEKTVKLRGGRISVNDARYLVRRVGTDQWRLHNEIDKLLAHDESIKRSDIDELVEPTLEETIFQMLDAAMQGKENHAVDLYESLSRRDLDPHQAVSMLGWQAHNMLLVKTNFDMAPNRLASQGGMAPFVAQKTKKLVRNLRLVQIKQLIDLILKAERDIKTTGIDAHRRTGHLIYQIAKTTSS